MKPDQTDKQRVVEVDERSAVGEAKRLAAAALRELGGDETVAAHAAIVAAELASNVVKHGGGGVLVIRQRRGPACALELLALDRGKGISALAESLRDGYSTAGSAGTGLGAVRRLSSDFDIFAPPSRGTAVLSRLLIAEARRSPGKPAPFAMGALSLPVRGEDVCGDAWAVREDGDGIVLLVADGLGHGPLAAEASSRAVATFGRLTGAGPAAAVTRLDEELHGTRGAAVAVAEIAPAHARLAYAGLGNISGRIYGGAPYVSLVSLQGTAGTGTRQTRAFTYDWPEGGTLVMHSDGVTSHWDLDDYPGLRGRDPVLIAGVLLRDARRERDDATVLVARSERAA